MTYQAEKMYANQELEELRKDKARLDLLTKDVYTGLVVWFNPLANNVGIRVTHKDTEKSRQFISVGETVREALDNWNKENNHE